MNSPNLSIQAFGLEAVAGTTSLLDDPWEDSIGTHMFRAASQTKPGSQIPVTGAAAVVATLGVTGAAVLTT